MSSPFYNTISQLRANEELILYDRIINFIPEEEQLVKEFLQIEYEAEALNYPFTAPVYDGAAALWAAKTIYIACQLILYRENKAEELPVLLPVYENDITAGSILSADLCLRFLPQVLVDTKHIDAEDSLISLIENHLQQWHYSGIGYQLKNEELNMDAILGNDCLKQLYIDRIIQKKDMKKALLPSVHKEIKAALGIYRTTFWKELNLENINE